MGERVSNRRGNVERCKLSKKGGGAERLETTGRQNPESRRELDDE